MLRRDPLERPFVVVTKSARVELKHQGNAIAKVHIERRHDHSKDKLRAAPTRAAGLRSVRTNVPAFLDHTNGG